MIRRELVGLFLVLALFFSPPAPADAASLAYGSPMDCISELDSTDDDLGCDDCLFDYELYKELTLPSFPDITVPVFRSKGEMGPPVLIVHGNSSSSRSFVFQVFTLLGWRHKLFLIDLPGFGRAGKVDPAAPLPVDENGIPIGFPEYQFGLLEAIAVAAADPEISPEVFVGWSLGGDLLLLAQGLGLIPDAKGLFIFGSAPAGANPPTTETPFIEPFVPGFFPLSILQSFGFSFQLDPESPIGFNLYGEFTDPVPDYAPPPISDAPNVGEAFISRFFAQKRCLQGWVPEFFLEDGFDRSDARARASIGVFGLGLSAPGPVQLPDELEVLQGLEGDPADPDDDIPILVMAGAEEALINVQYLEDLKNAGFIPTLWKNRIIKVRRAGHAVHFDRPFVFNFWLATFLRDIAD